MEWGHPGASGGLCGTHPALFWFDMVEHKALRGMQVNLNAGHQIFDPRHCLCLGWYIYGEQNARAQLSKGR
jgi:hypothetical protein